MWPTVGGLSVDVHLSFTGFRPSEPPELVRQLPCHPATGRSNLKASHCATQEMNRGRTGAEVLGRQRRQEAEGSGLAVRPPGEDDAYVQHACGPESNPCSRASSCWKWVQPRTSAARILPPFESRHRPSEVQPCDFSQPSPRPASPHSSSLRLNGHPLFGLQGHRGLQLEGGERVEQRFLEAGGRTTRRASDSHCCVLFLDTCGLR